MTPDDRKYAKSHEWVKMEDGLAIIGITDHAQEALGDITFVDLPDVGEAISVDGDCGVIESVKAASDLYAPIAGQVSEVNTELEDSPESLNQSPYEDGWILKLASVDEVAVEALMSATEYEQFLTEEA